MSLLDYHAFKGRLQGREGGRVAWVADPKDPRKPIPHLTGLLVPVLTLEDLHEEEGSLALSLPWEERRRRTREIASWIGRRLGLGTPEAVRAQAYRLSIPKLMGRRAVSKPADALRVGFYRAQETALALLRLDGAQGWPEFLRRALLRAFGASGASLRLHTLHAHPSQGLAFREALRKAKEEGSRPCWSSPRPWPGKTATA